MENIYKISSKGRYSVDLDKISDKKEFRKYALAIGPSEDVNDYLLVSSGQKISDNIITAPAYIDKSKIKAFKSKLMKSLKKNRKKIDLSQFDDTKSPEAPQEASGDVAYSFKLNKHGDSLAIFNKVFNGVSSMVFNDTPVNFDEEKFIFEIRKTNSVKEIDGEKLEVWEVGLIEFSNNKIISNKAFNKKDRYSSFRDGSSYGAASKATKDFLKSNIDEYFKFNDGNNHIPLFNGDSGSPFGSSSNIGNMEKIKTTKYAKVIKKIEKDKPIFIFDEIFGDQNYVLIDVEYMKSDTNSDILSQDDSRYILFKKNMKIEDVIIKQGDAYVFDFSNDSRVQIIPIVEANDMHKKSSMFILGGPDKNGAYKLTYNKDFDLNSFKALYDSISKVSYRNLFKYDIKKEKYTMVLPSNSLFLNKRKDSEIYELLKTEEYPDSITFKLDIKSGVTSNEYGISQDVYSRFVQSKLEKNEYVYLDPTYTKSDSKNSFDLYLFNEIDATRNRKYCMKSFSDNPNINDESFLVFKNISSKPLHRNKNEIVLEFFPNPTFENLLTVENNPNFINALEDNTFDQLNKTIVDFITVNNKTPDIDVIENNLNKNRERSDTVNLSYIRTFDDVIMKKMNMDSDSFSSFKNSIDYGFVKKGTKNVSNFIVNWISPDKGTKNPLNKLELTNSNLGIITSKKLNSAKLDKDIANNLKREFNVFKNDIDKIEKHANAKTLDSVSALYDALITSMAFNIMNDTGKVNNILYNRYEDTLDKKNDMSIKHQISLLKKSRYDQSAINSIKKTYSNIDIDKAYNDIKSEFNPIIEQYNKIEELASTLEKRKRLISDRYGKGKFNTINDIKKNSKELLDTADKKREFENDIGLYKTNTGILSEERNKLYYMSGKYETLDFITYKPTIDDDESDIFDVTYTRGLVNPKSFRNAIFKSLLSKLYLNYKTIFKEEKNRDSNVSDILTGLEKSDIINEIPIDKKYSTIEINNDVISKLKKAINDNIVNANDINPLIFLNFSDPDFLQSRIEYLDEEIEKMIDDGYNQKDRKLKIKSIEDPGVNEKKELNKLKVHVSIQIGKGEGLYTQEIITSDDETRKYIYNTSEQQKRYGFYFDYIKTFMPEFDSDSKNHFSHKSNTNLHFLFKSNFFLKDLNKKIFEYNKNIDALDSELIKRLQKEANEKISRMKDKELVSFVNDIANNLDQTIDTSNFNKKILNDYMYKKLLNNVLHVVVFDYLENRVESKKLVNERKIKTLYEFLFEDVQQENINEESNIGKYMLPSSVGLVKLNKDKFEIIQRCDVKFTNDESKFINDITYNEYRKTLPKNIINQLGDSSPGKKVELINCSYPRNTYHDGTYIPHIPDKLEEDEVFFKLKATNKNLDKNKGYEIVIADDFQKKINDILEKYQEDSESVFKTFDVEEDGEMKTIKIKIGEVLNGIHLILDVKNKLKIDQGDDIRMVKSGEVEFYRQGHKKRLKPTQKIEILSISPKEGDDIEDENESAISAGAATMDSYITALNNKMNSNANLIMKILTTTDASEKNKIAKEVRYSINDIYNSNKDNMPPILRSNMKTATELIINKTMGILKESPEQIMKKKEVPFLKWEDGTSRKTSFHILNYIGFDMRRYSEMKDGKEFYAGNTSKDGPYFVIRSPEQIKNVDLSSQKVDANFDKQKLSFIDRITVGGKQVDIKNGYTIYPFDSDYNTQKYKEALSDLYIEIEYVIPATAKTSIGINNELIGECMKEILNDKEIIFKSVLELDEILYSKDVSMKGAFSNKTDGGCMEFYSTYDSSTFKNILDENNTNKIEEVEKFISYLSYKLTKNEVNKNIIYDDIRYVYLEMIVPILIDLNLILETYIKSLELKIDIPSIILEGALCASSICIMYNYENKLLNTINDILINDIFPNDRSYLDFISKFKQNKEMVESLNKSKNIVFVEQDRKIHIPKNEIKSSNVIINYIETTKLGLFNISNTGKETIDPHSYPNFKVELKSKKDFQKSTNKNLRSSIKQSIGNIIKNANNTIFNNFHIDKSDIVAANTENFDGSITNKDVLDFFNEKDTETKLSQYILTDKKSITKNKINFSIDDNLLFRQIENKKAFFDTIKEKAKMLDALEQRGVLKVNNFNKLKRLFNPFTTDGAEISHTLVAIGIARKLYPNNQSNQNEDALTTENVQYIDTLKKYQDYGKEVLEEDEKNKLQDYEGIISFGNLGDEDGALLNFLSIYGINKNAILAYALSGQIKDYYLHGKVTHLGLLNRNIVDIDEKYMTKYISNIFKGEFSNYVEILSNFDKFNSNDKNTLFNSMNLISKYVKGEYGNIMKVDTIETNHEILLNRLKDVEYPRNAKVIDIINKIKESLKAIVREHSKTKFELKNPVVIDFHIQSKEEVDNAYFDGIKDGVLSQASSINASNPDMSAFLKIIPTLYEDGEIGKKSSYNSAELYFTRNLTLKELCIMNGDPYEDNKEDDDTSSFINTYDFLVNYTNISDLYDGTFKENNIQHIKEISTLEPGIVIYNNNNWIPVRPYMKVAVKYKDNTDISSRNVKNSTTEKIKNELEVLQNNIFKDDNDVIIYTFDVNRMTKINVSFNDKDPQLITSGNPSKDHIPIMNITPETAKKIDNPTVNYKNKGHIILFKSNNESNKYHFIFNEFNSDLKIKSRGTFPFGSVQHKDEKPNLAINLTSSKAINIFQEDDVDTKEIKGGEYFKNIKPGVLEVIGPKDNDTHIKYRIEKPCEIIFSERENIKTLKSVYSLMDELSKNQAASQSDNISLNSDNVHKYISTSQINNQLEALNTRYSTKSNTSNNIIYYRNKENFGEYKYSKVLLKGHFLTEFPIGYKSSIITNTLFEKSDVPINKKNIEKSYKYPFILIYPKEQTQSYNGNEMVHAYYYPNPFLMYNNIHDDMSVNTMERKQSIFGFGFENLVINNGEKFNMLDFLHLHGKGKRTNLTSEENKRNHNYDQLLQNIKSFIEKKRVNILENFNKIKKILQTEGNLKYGIEHDVISNPQKLFIALMLKYISANKEGIDGNKIIKSHKYFKIPKFNKSIFDVVNTGIFEISKGDMNIEKISIVDSIELLYNSEYANKKMSQMEDSDIKNIKSIDLFNIMSFILKTDIQSFLQKEITITFKHIFNENKLIEKITNISNIYLEILKESDSLIAMTYLRQSIYILSYIFDDDNYLNMETLQRDEEIVEGSDITFEDLIDIYKENYKTFELIKRINNPLKPKSSHLYATVKMEKTEDGKDTTSITTDNIIANISDDYTKKIKEDTKPKNVVANIVKGDPSNDNSFKVLRLGELRFLNNGEFLEIINPVELEFGSLLDLYKDNDFGIYQSLAFEDHLDKTVMKEINIDNVNKSDDGLDLETIADPNEKSYDQEDDVLKRSRDFVYNNTEDEEIAIDNTEELKKYFSELINNKKVYNKLISHIKYNYVSQLDVSYDEHDLFQDTMIDILNTISLQYSTKLNNIKNSRDAKFVFLQSLNNKFKDMLRKKRIMMSYDDAGLDRSGEKTYDSKIMKLHDFTMLLETGKKKKGKIYRLNDIFNKKRKGTS